MSSPASIPALARRARVVLCRTQHPGNIGSAARAMKTMGITDLRLVAPLAGPVNEDRWMATHAADVVENLRTHATLDEAIHDCEAAFALSARPREWSLEVLSAREAGVRAAALEGPVAFVFGNEQAGLTNEEMLACRCLVQIPANPAFSSLNLAQAVQVVCYEWFMACGAAPVRMRTEKPASMADLERLYEHLTQAAIESEFYDPASGSKLPTRWRRLFSRVPALEREEVNILRGLLGALQSRRRGNS